MKSRILFAAMLLAAVQMYGMMLSPEEALARVGREVPVTGRAIAAQRPALVHTTDMPGTDSPACYVFASPETFMVLSADDRAVPMLGYGDASTFDPDNIPPGMAAWLEGYGAEMAAAYPLATKRGVRPHRPEIEPLMSTKWDQGMPYNLKCPRQNGKRTYSGCVATAFAQVAYFHRWPEKHGTGTKSYTWDDMTLTFDYDKTTFQWDQMLPEYADNASSLLNPANNAVATLMYAVGVVSEMIYGTDASGTWMGSAIMGMAQHMGYSPNAHIANRNSYGPIEWEELIYSELADGRPVPYDGANASPAGNYAAHAFVVDGYDGEGFFHVNWGWGGISDGYFLLSALDPNMQGAGGSADGYSYASAAVIGFAPATEDEILEQYSIYSAGIYPLQQTSLRSEECSLRIYELTNLSAEILPETFIGLCISNDEYTDIQALAYIEGVKPNFYYPEVDLNFSIPADLPDGRFKCTLMYSTDRGDSWFDGSCNIYAGSEFVMECTGDSVYFQAQRAVMPQIGNIAVTKTAYGGHSVSVTGTATNPSATDSLLVPMFCQILDPGTDQYTPAGNYMMLCLEPGEHIDFEYNAQLPETSGQSLLAFFAIDGTYGTMMVSDPVEITIHEDPGTPEVSPVPGFVLSATVPEDSDEALVSFDGKLECVKGIGGMWTYIEVVNTATQSWGYDAQFIEYEVGTTTSVHLTTTISNSHVGDICSVRILVHDGSDFVEVMPSQQVTVTEALGVNELTVDGAQQPAVYYNLQGVRVANPDHGVYIKDGTKVYISR